MSLPAAAIPFFAPLLFIGCSSAEPVTSQLQACEIVKRAAIDFCLSRTNLTGRYYCEPMPPNPEHYRLGLRYEVNPDELVGSNLIGWFADRKADGVVLAEDVADGSLNPLRSGVGSRPSSTHAPANKALQQTRRLFRVVAVRGSLGATPFGRGLTSAAGAAQLSA